MIKQLAVLLTHFENGKKETWKILMYIHPTKIKKIHQTLSFIIYI